MSPSELALRGVAEEDQPHHEERLLGHQLVAKADAVGRHLALLALSGRILALRQIHLLGPWAARLAGVLAVRLHAALDAGDLPYSTRRASVNVGELYTCRWYDPGRHVDEDETSKEAPPSAPAALQSPD